jgi:hypothetical protein
MSKVLRPPCGRGRSNPESPFSRDCTDGEGLSSNRRTLAGEVGFAISCLVLVALGRVIPDALGAVAGVAGATLSIGVLPGYLLITSLSAGRRAPLPERCVLGVGFSLFLVQGACVIALTLHIPLHVMGQIFLFLVVILAANKLLLRTRLSGPVEHFISPDEERASNFLHPIALCGWITAGSVAFAIGNVDVASPLENLLAVGIATALRTAVQIQDAFYAKGISPVYPFPGLHYAYALVADISNTTTVFAFEKMRGLWTLTALATVFVGVRALSGSSCYAYLALLGSSLLALAGPFGTVPGYYWGQLATMSNPNDVEMNVLAGIALCSLFTVLASADRARPEMILLFSCTALVLSMIHQRELVQLLVYGAAGVVVLARSGQYRTLPRLGLALVVPTCGALAFRAWAVAYGPGTGNLLVDVHTRLLSDLRQLDLSTAFHPYPSGVNAYDSSFLWGLNSFMLCIASIVLICRRDNPAVRASALAAAAFLMTASFAILAIPVIFLTYDELLNTPVRHVIFLLYCCLWIVLGMLLKAVDSRWAEKPTMSAAIAVCAAAIAAGVAHLLARTITSAEILVLPVAACALVAAFLPYRQRPGTAQSPPSLSIGLPSSLAALIIFTLLTAMPHDALLRKLADGLAAWTPQAALKNEYRAYLAAQPGSIEGGCRERTATVLGRTIDFRSCAPPFQVVDWLHLHLPKDSVLLFDPLGDFAPVGLVPAKLAVPPSFLYRNWEMSFSHMAAVIAHSVGSYGGMPFFASGETPEQRYADANALGATHVLADPAARVEALNTVQSRPDLFTVVMDQSQWILLAIKR